ncbi:MAG: MarR family transcriptional regulator [Turicibacter sp.]|nr:MarR family transcriptional regulator [Turicibacter sp.]
MEKITNAQLIEQFYKAGYALRRFEFQNNNKSPIFFAGGHRGQGRVLSILKDKPEITQKELVSLLRIRPQSLGELLTKLEAQGFITREPSKKDRRMTIVKLTEVGKEEIKKNNQMGDSIEKIFNILDDEEKDQLYHILDKLSKELEENIDSDTLMEKLLMKHREKLRNN